MNADEDLLAGLLDDYETLEPSIELQHEEPTPDLPLLGIHQLLVETEALLASIEVPVASSESESGAQEAKVAKRRLKYANRIKNERKTLEEEAKALSEELHHLQHTRKKVKSLWDKSSAMPLWRAIATRQMEGRLVAEEQQHKLKHAVETRAKVLEEIGAMVRTKLDHAERDEMTIIPQNNELDADDCVLYEEFLQDLDVIYAETDAVFRACGVEEMPQTSYRLGPDWKKDGDLEYIDKLDHEETCSTMWQSMLHVNRQKDRHHYNNVADSENTVAAKLRMRPMHESGERVDMLVHLAMRRYIEAGRIVMVWRALSHGEGEFDGMHSDETGWCLVRPNDEELDENSLMRTVIQTFVRFIPMSVANTAGRVDGFQFTKFVVTSVEKDADEVARLMDSLLLDDPKDAASSLNTR
ncbi:hypothetical protein PHYSODRAFT_305814 [Phytophthora sojae]|uniref:Uncharacterized protein n=1 Tax=Phytophthora sojae (strain P6497) TaxID=1094619 RepID=G5A6Q6_PHYSP|nr:hypothetical protein PHYSODRAFT_305814 [Phytophthora sojae]EGZ09011.1 hypothetical protein PHYSODRAFT_305814 [Phytophthora sojae]|eukprot:XP_009535644.1 hypothetical protein PHYSODRAFT_305814 [Phytophthora sojae]